MNELNTLELQFVNGGGGRYSNAINAIVGGIAVANFIAIGALTAPVWGGVALVGGCYCLYNAIY